VFVHSKGLTVNPNATRTAWDFFPRARIQRPWCAHAGGLGPGEEQGWGEGLCRALVAAPGARGCWWSLVVLALSSCAGCSPAAFAVGVAASRAPEGGRGWVAAINTPLWRPRWRAWAAAGRSAAHWGLQTAMRLCNARGIQPTDPQAPVM
jgi:hypothetical protein